MEGSLKATKSDTALPVQEDSDDTSGSHDNSTPSPGSVLEAGRAAVVGAREFVDAKVLGAKDFVDAKVADSASYASSQLAAARSLLAQCYAKALSTVEGAQAAAVAKASALSTTVHSVASDRTVQVTAASAAGGAVALGAGGGATGLAAGTVLGAAAGVVPALFTFGLSIPVGAMAGGGAGLVLGTTVGGTVGAVGGGAAGYGVYKKREDIGKCIGYAQEKADQTKEYVKDTTTAAFSKAKEAADVTKAQAYASAEYVAERASAAKNRLVGRSGTGGTETAD